MADDLDRFREFMIEQQAQFWADLRAGEAERKEQARKITQLIAACSGMLDGIKQNSDRIERNGELIERNSELIEGNSQQIARTSELVERNSQQIARTSELVERNSQQMAELRQSQVASDQRMNALVAVVAKIVTRN